MPYNDQTGQWENEPDPLSYNDYFSGSASPAPTAPASTGGAPNLDPGYLQQQVTAALEKRKAQFGTPYTEQDVAYFVQKASTPDLYSDGKWRVGFNPYWESVIVTGRGDPSMAGLEGIVDAPAGWSDFSAGSGSLGDLVAPFTKDLPAWQAPSFKAPTGDDLLKDPGYQFRLDEGSKALQASRAAQGVLNGGGTLKDVLDWGQKAASQEYGNMFDRSLSAFDRNYRSSFDQYGSGFNKWLQDYNIFRNQQNDTFNKQFSVTGA